jgi:hypothetical protein
LAVAQPPDQTPVRPHSGEITRLLASIRAGDRQALNELFPLVYAELRTAAHRHLRAPRAGDTLGTTALVDEAYLKFVGDRGTGGSTGALLRLGAAPPVTPEAILRAR